MSSERRWMIYGANGYTGLLIAEAAKRAGMSPILAGRNGDEVRALAGRLGFEARVFDLDSPDLSGVSLVLHCAGPFSATSRKMLDACLRARAHYLDITGEIDVFESVFARAKEIEQAGITAIPGVGFDVVPTDCLAALLKRELPDATHLTMGFRFDSKPSPGTAKTAIEGLTQGGRVRKSGQLVRVGVAANSREIAIREPSRPEHCVLMPWGDVSTAYHSTGIPNVEFYMTLPKGMVRGMRALSAVGRVPGMQRLLKKWVDLTFTGPSAKTRESTRTWLWGEVSNPAGRRVELRMNAPEGYHFTVDSALASVRKILAGGIRPGALTPSLAFGADFVYSIPGVERPKQL